MADHLIPPEAMDEWRELVSALEVHGPAPCEEAGVADLWHADKVAQVAEAVTGCRGCGAAPECLAYALAADERYGVWGGAGAIAAARRAPSSRVVTRPPSAGDEQPLLVDRKRLQRREVISDGKKHRVSDLGR